MRRSLRRNRVRADAAIPRVYRSAAADENTASRRGLSQRKSAGGVPVQKQRRRSSDGGLSSFGMNFSTAWRPARAVCKQKADQRSFTWIVNERSSVRPPKVTMRLVTVYDWTAT